MNIPTISRRSALLAGGTAAALALSACGGSSSAGDTESGDGAIKVAVFPSFNALGAHAAKTEGVFKEHGLKAKFVTVASPSEATPQLLGGKIDFALMDVTTPVIARSQGVPLVMVAPGGVGTKVPADGFGVGNFWVAEGSDITSIKDIQNATVGVPQTKSQITVDIRTAVDEAGGDSSKIKFAEVPNTLAALKSGSVDVVTTSEPSGTEALGDKGIEHLAGYTPGEVGELAYTFVTTEKYAKANPEQVNNFSESIIAANKKLNSSNELPAKVAATYIDAPESLLDKALYKQFGEEPISKQAVGNAIDRVRRYDLVSEGKAPAPKELLADK